MCMLHKHLKEKNTETENDDHIIINRMYFLLLYISDKKLDILRCAPYMGM